MLDKHSSLCYNSKKNYGEEVMVKKDFRKRWIESFAKGADEKELETFVLANGNYLWHLFSWEVLDSQKFLEGNDAKKAFEQLDKNGAIYIDWGRSEETKEWTNETLELLSKDELNEIYVVASDFSWTYMVTSQESFGPYFMKKD